MKCCKEEGFTLIEICLAVAIALVMLMIAVPSISGVLKGEQANQPFEQFDRLVRNAQARSVSERRTYLIGWEKDQIVLRPERPVSDQEAKGIERIVLTPKESCELVLSAALLKKPTKEWAFWPSGTREPATVSYNGPSGGWTAVYRPLSEKPELIEQ